MTIEELREEERIRKTDLWNALSTRLLNLDELLLVARYGTDRREKLAELQRALTMQQLLQTVTLREGK